MSLNKELRVRSKPHTDLDTLLITVMAIMPFLPYILSAAVLIVVSMSLLFIKQTRKALIRQKNMLIIVAAITAISLVGSLISGNWIGIAIAYGVFLILVFAAYAREVMNKELFDRVLLVNCFGALVTVAAVIVQRLQDDNEFFRPYGFSFNANYLGLLATFSALLAIFYFVEEWEQPKNKLFYLKKVAAVMAALANCFTLLICRSRSSLLALMVCTFVYLLLKKWYILCAVIAAGGIGVCVLGYVSPEYFGWANSLLESFTERASIWACAMDIFLSSPLNVIIGCGPMTYRFIWQSGVMDGSKWTNLDYIIERGFISSTASAYDQDAALTTIASAAHVHNIVFDTLVNVGIIGAIFYLLLISGFIKNAIVKLKYGDKKAFNLSIIAICAIFVSGIADVTIMWHQTATMFALMCAASFVPKKE